MLLYLLHVRLSFCERHWFSDIPPLIEPGIATEMSVWDGVVVKPLERAYVKPPDRKEEDEDMEGVSNTEDEASAQPWMFKVMIGGSPFYWLIF